jgi:zinc transporter 1/2/3
LEEGRLGWNVAHLLQIVTPVAMALGVGIRASFSQNGKASLLAVGVLDSLSAGILVSIELIKQGLPHQLYTAFKLLHLDFIEGPLKDAPTSRCLLAGAMIFLGCFLMSLLGKWA